MIYDYIIIGGGISGCSIAYQLSNLEKNNTLLIDKYADVAGGASGAAGAFLSPLLGKPNNFKDLVTTSLKYSSNLYQNNFQDYINNCGTIRVPKNKIDADKFQDYIPFMDFDYSLKDNGYLFKIGSVVNSYQICKEMVKNINCKFNYLIENIVYDGEYWILNNNLKTKNLILATGADDSLIKEFYLKIRAVWGRRIDIETTTEVKQNYHKACSVSKSFLLKEDKIDKKSIYKVSIGASHHRDIKNIKERENDIDELLKKANDIIDLKDINFLKDYIGARACSVDYFPMVGEIIDSQKTIKEFPYLKKGTNVANERFTRYKNLYILNGVGGRGFVLAPYLAKQLVENLVYNKEIDLQIKVDRLFKREVKKSNRY